MIIRGNTVSTPIAPKKVAEEIGSIAPIYVTLDKSTGKASYTAAEIYTHIDDGGVVYLHTGNEIIPLVYSSIGMAEFNSYVTDQDLFRGAQVFKDGSYVIVNTDIVTEDILEENMGDISSALDELHTYAQGLIGGAAE
jgi:hypothetical protein